MTVTDQAKKLAQNYLQKKVSSDEESLLPTEIIEAPRLVDLACFVIAFDSYLMVLEAKGDKPGPVYSKATTMITRYKEEITAAIEQHLAVIAERPDAGSFRVAMRMALRRGNPVTMARSQAQLFKVIFPWMRSRQAILTGIFSGRSLKAARELASIVEEDSPEGILNKVATIAPVSGLWAPRKWVTLAAAEVGVPLGDLENVLVDAQVARGLGEDLALVESRLTVVKQGTPESADLQDERLSLLEKIDQVADRSGDRSSILAVAAMAKPTQQFATAIGKKLGHTPDQEDAMMARGRVLIAAGAGSGKCIRGDTLVQTEKGFIPISDLCLDLEEDEDEPLQMLVHGKDGPEKTSHVYFDGLRETLRVETAQGYEIEGTAKHRVLALREGVPTWEMLQDLVPGDILCLDRRPGLFAETPFTRQPFEIQKNRNTVRSTQIPLELTPQVANLLGYIVSEGYIRSDSWSISITTTDTEQRDLYLKSLAGLIQHQERLDDRHTRQYVLEFNRHIDVQALLGFGLTRTLAQGKEIPAGILQSPKPVVTAFLRALFDGDGWVDTNTVGYCTASTKLATQLQTVLLAYGIPARRKFRPNKGTGAWHFSISGSGLRRFALEIGFNLQNKQNKLLDLASRPENTNIDVIPGIENVCHTVQKQYWAQTGTTKTEDPTYGTMKCLVNGSRRPSRDTLTRFLDFYPGNSPETELLKALTKGDWFFDPIVGITPALAPVYDFVVPGTHSFSAGGFINHNTRVLASKVVFHIQEQGIDPAAILATTFTTKAAAELVKRAKDYGAVIEGTALDGFGTTHSICGKFLNRKATSFRRPGYIGKKEGWKQSTILRLAMEQVKMKVPGAPAPPHRPKGIWEGTFVSETKAVSTPEKQTGPGEDMTEYLNNIDIAIGYFQWAGRTWSAGPGDWARRQVPFLQDMRAVRPEKLTPKQRQWVNDLFIKVKGRNPISYRVAAGETEEALPAPRGKRNKLEDYTFFKSPSRQWFNLGRELTRKVGDSEQAIPMGEFKNAISILKGKGLSPSEAWHGSGPYGKESDHAAVYAAYEWLKGGSGESEFAGLGDMDDLLVDTVSALIGSPTLRRQMQAQYKVLLIDEAQDLNRVQHLIFGLIAGYLDPATLQPNPDKHMSADTYALIGDDKQAIYGFRGADADEFIDRSDMVPGGDNFKTKLLDTNFRSGKDIVEAANRLIAHNAKQVPMVCKANVDRNGNGKVVSRKVDSTEDAAVSVAEEISGMMEAGDAGTSKYKDFGLAVRSNAEAYHYGLEMLKKGIPFKSNAQFFNDPNTKALIGWLTIVEKGLDGPKEEMEQAIRDAVRAPYARLGQAFFTALEERSSGSWARWLVDGGWERIYSRPDMKSVVQHFTNNLSAAAKFTGIPSQVTTRLMDLKGLDGGTMREAMIKAVEEDDTLMAELAAEADNGQVSQDQIIEQAMAPVEPLLGLMKGKDNLESAMTFVRKLRKVNEKISSGDSETEIDRDAVTIGTMHSWKGLEVQNMYVPMIGSKFPRAGKEGVAPESPDLWSERRLAYVAITRAEQKCVILDIPHPTFGTRSQFIGEACMPTEGTSEEQGVSKMASDQSWEDSDIDDLRIGDPEDEMNLEEAWASVPKLAKADIRLNKWDQEHGSKPKGQGSWFFQFGPGDKDPKKDFKGTYAEAKKQAEKHAETLSYTGPIWLLP